MYMQEYTPTLEIQVKSNKGQCGILIFVEAFRWTLKLHLYIYICLWMAKALYRLFFQYNVNVLGFQNMLHVYIWCIVKRFFLMLCYTRLSQKFNWQVTLFSQAARAMKILQQKEYAYVLCNSIVWKCPVFYVHDIICDMQAQVWSISCSWWNLEAARFHFSFIFYWRHLNYNIYIELNCPIKIPFKNPPNYLHMS